MAVDPPGPGARPADGAPSEPRDAATVILLRGGATALEVLLVKRNPAQRFMGGAWVFPGGAVDAGEGADDSGHRLAAVREVFEEVSVVLPDPAQLVAFSRWITPAQIPIRFDTRFFLAALPTGARPRIDGSECVDLGWFSPRGALDAHAAGSIALVFPTIRHLEQLEGFGSAGQLLAWARGRAVVPVEPRLVLEGEVARLLLPGDPGYADAPSG